MNARAVVGKVTPKVMFLDTEQFQAKGLSFANANFKRLSDLVADGLAKVLLTEIVVGEVRRHVQINLKDAQKKLGQKFGGLFQNLEHSPTPPPLNDEYWANAEKEVLDHFDKFCKDVKAEVLPTNPELVKAVFDWYFAADAPFDTAKRKSEFPDAFSLACINQWAETQNSDVHVISKDEAFRIMSREVNRSSKLLRLESLNAFFELFPDPALAKAIKKSFSEFLESEENYAFGEETFQNLGFYLESDEESDAREVEGVSLMYSEPYRLHVVEAKNGKAVIAGDIYVHFFADITGEHQPVERSTFVSAEIVVDYDQTDPGRIKVQSVQYDKAWAIGVYPPSSRR
jgi:hypothetical protein